jgi:D-serine deaminase-like pyridoxal phosphate-dependent protein
MLDGEMSTLGNTLRLFRNICESIQEREEKEMSRLKGNRIGMHKNEIETPVLMVDLDVMERNLKKMADYFKGVKAKLRPHTKSHKTPALAHKQIEAGAIGICCGCLDEAQVMISAGIRDVLVTREIVLPGEITRVVGLARHSDIMVPVDNEELAERISQAAVMKGGD